MLTTPLSLRISTAHRVRGNEGYGEAVRSSLVSREGPEGSAVGPVLSLDLLLAWGSTRSSVGGGPTR